MSDKFGLMSMAHQEDKYLGGKSYLDCGEETAAEIDREIMKMLSDAYDKAKIMIADNRDVLEKIAAHLIQQETITGKEFMEIMQAVIDER
jgi:cell division protease FtsH